MKTETLEAIGAAGSKATMFGGGMAIAGKLSATDIAAYVGAAVAIIGLVITWYYRREANRRNAELHNLKAQESKLRIQLMQNTGLPAKDCTDWGELGVDK